MLALRGQLQRTETQPTSTCLHVGAQYEYNI